MKQTKVISVVSSFVVCHFQCGSLTLLSSILDAKFKLRLCYPLRVGIMSFLAADICISNDISLLVCIYFILFFHFPVCNV